MNSSASITSADGLALAENKTPLWRRKKAIANYIALIPYLAFALFPFYIIFITSLKSKQEINNLGQSPFWTRGIYWENFTFLWTDTVFFEHWMVNTFIVTTISTVISVTIGITPHAMASARAKPEPSS